MTDVTARNAMSAWESSHDESWDGLDAGDVRQRVSAGQTNTYVDRSSRSLADIIRANVFTLFNAILTTALLVVLATGQWQDALFGIVLVLNTGIGIVTEYRAKRTLDKLAILSADKVRVKRGGYEMAIASGEIVLGDLILMKAGEQIVADAVLISTTGLEVDESMLTGESDPVYKKPGDPVLSGSFVVAGSGAGEIMAVGADSYANRLAAQAKKFSLAQSELRAGINKILVVMAWVIVPMSALLTWSQLRYVGGLSKAIEDDTWRDPVVSAVAGVVGMIPDGLMLLTSLNFALAAIQLARQRVLVQELPAVEILARVDTLCLDKTGTITDGTIQLSEVIDIADVDGAHGALAALGADSQGNATAAAIAEGFTDAAPDKVRDTIPFSSARKWGAITTDSGSWYMGAPEILLDACPDSVADPAREVVQGSATTGARVVVLCRSDATGIGQEKDVSLPSDLEPALVVVLREHIREDAAETLAYFREQHVDLKIISGDNPATVGAIATQVNLLGEDTDVPGVDARTLPDGERSSLPELGQALSEGSVFGRVTPEQKRSFVHALQERGHTVAMTGDGVNDALALKDADLGIAMGNGAPATKSVARLVLLDGKFSVLPGIVAQGRRVIANMERVANLFLVKMVYSGLLSVAVILLGWPYPFLPRHMTLVSSVTIGIPAFILALAPNSQRYRPGFLKRVLRFAIPAGIVAGVITLIIYGNLHIRGDVSEEQANTGSTLVIALIGLWVIGCMARPWNWWRILLIVVMALGMPISIIWELPREFFQLEIPLGATWLMVGIGAAVGSAIVELIYQYTKRLSSEED